MEKQNSEKKRRQMFLFAVLARLVGFASGEPINSCAPLARAAAESSPPGSVLRWFEPCTNVAAIAGSLSRSRPPACSRSQNWLMVSRYARAVFSDWVRFDFASS
jgi:hypothetical protein